MPWRLPRAAVYYHRLVGSTYYLAAAKLDNNHKASILRTVPARLTGLLRSYIMNAVAKPIVSIPRAAATLALFGEVATIAKSQSAKLETLAVDLAKQVESIALPISSKVALLEATYSAEYTVLAADRNCVAQLRALVWTKVAGNTVVEVTPPSKDGKTAAVFSPANKLSPKAAKVHLAQLKAVVREAEETPEQKAERAKVADKIKLDAQVKANAEATEAARVKSIEAFAYVLSEAQRPHLIAELKKIGYALVKCKASPQE